MNREEFQNWKHLPETKEVFAKIEKDLTFLGELIAAGTYLGDTSLVPKDVAIQTGRYLGIKDIVTLEYEDIFGA